MKWAKMGHFFDYFYNFSKLFIKMMNFMIDYGQCVFSLLQQKRKLPPRNERVGQTPLVVACTRLYTLLFPSVSQSVIHKFFFMFYDSVTALLLPKWSSDIYGP